MPMYQPTMQAYPSNNVVVSTTLTDHPLLTSHFPVYSPPKKQVEVKSSTLFQIEIFAQFHANGLLMCDGMALSHPRFSTPHCTQFLHAYTFTPQNFALVVAPHHHCADLGALKWQHSFISKHNKECSHTEHCMHHTKDADPLLNPHRCSYKTG
jgi:hypothetical protein